MKYRALFFCLILYAALVATALFIKSPALAALTSTTIIPLGIILFVRPGIPLRKKMGLAAPIAFGIPLVLLVIMSSMTPEQTPHFLLFNISFAIYLACAGALVNPSLVEPAQRG